MLTIALMKGFMRSMHRLNVHSLVDWRVSLASSYSKVSSDIMKLNPMFLLIVDVLVQTISDILFSWALKGCYHFIGQFLL